MAHRELVIHIEAGEPRVGLWCDACSLPSGIEIDVLMVTDHGVSTHSTIYRCTEEEDVT